MWFHWPTTIALENPSQTRAEDERKETELARKDRELARIALKRAYDWAIRFGDNGWRGFADDYPAAP